jgi:recombination protein RecR
MRLIPEPVEKLIEEFGRLPSIGPRTAERLTFYLLKAEPDQASALGRRLQELHQDLTRCQICRNLATSPVCEVCSSDQRDQSLIAVVEEPLDVVAIEKTGQFKGLYHVLGGTNPSTEGEATALYIRRALGDRPMRLTRLARGLPMGGDLEYADQITLGRALQGRQTF